MVQTLGSCQNDSLHRRDICDRFTKKSKICAKLVCCRCDNFMTGFLTTDRVKRLKDLLLSLLYVHGKVRTSVSEPVYEVTHAGLCYIK